MFSEFFFFKVVLIKKKATTNLLCLQLLDWTYISEG